MILAIEETHKVLGAIHRDVSTYYYVIDVADDGTTDQARQLLVRQEWSHCDLGLWTRDRLPLGELPLSLPDSKCTECDEYRPTMARTTNNSVENYSTSMESISKMDTSLLLLVDSIKISEPRDQMRRLDRS